MLPHWNNNAACVDRFDLCAKLCSVLHVSYFRMLHTVTNIWKPALCFSAGSFGEAGAQTDQYVEWLREYCQVFFYGLTVKLLPAVTVAQTGCSFRVNSNSHNLQILTGKFRNNITLKQLKLHELFLIKEGDWLLCFYADIKNSKRQKSVNL